MSQKEILIVSLDVHKKTHFAHCELKTTAKSVGKDFSFSNSASGFSLFFTEIQNRLKQNNIPSLAIVLEPTGPYWKPLAYAIASRNWPLYLVSTEQVFHQRIADDPAASKTDPADPKTIAKLFRDDKASLARLPYGIFLEMRRLHREYTDITKKLAREKIQLKSLLSEVNPEFPSFFSNIFGKIPITILSIAPSPQHICALGIDKLYSIFKSHGNGIIGHRKASKLFSLMQSSIAVSNNSVLPILNRTLERISTYKKQIEQVASSLSQLANPWSSKLTPIHGINSLSASRFIAELGDPSFFHSPKSFVCLAGIAPKSWSSGSSIRKKSKISKKGNPFLRTIVFYMALSCIRNNPPLKLYYQHLISNNKPKMVAIFAVARKLLHVIYHVLNDEPYIPEKLASGSK